MTTSTHYSFKLLTTDDDADIEKVSDNFSALDTALWDLSNNTVNATGDTEATSSGAGAIKTAGGIYAAKKIYGSQVFNAVWNDYAECRKAASLVPGLCLRESESGEMVLTEKRLQPGCKVISDTYGSCMGETAEARTPVGVAGRVLAVPYRDRKKYKLGAPVCSGPNGTVDRMTRLEAILFPERIIGTVSEIPDYEGWQAGTAENPQIIPVAGRIWIYVR